MKYYKQKDGIWQKTNIPKMLSDGLKDWDIFEAIKNVIRFNNSVWLTNTKTKEKYEIRRDER